MTSLPNTCKEAQNTCNKSRSSSILTNSNASAYPNVKNANPGAVLEGTGPSVAQPSRSIQFSDDDDLTNTSSLSSGATSPASYNADHDSLSSTDTEGSSGNSSEAEEEAAEDWEFQITPDMTRRLSVLPPPPTSLLNNTHHQPTITLSTLPNELKLEIFSYLDPIDGTSLGLTSRHSYLIYRAIHPTPIPLTTRRVGPNLLESAWATNPSYSLAKECPQCGVYRCELWKHIKTWMGNSEYCSMKGSFGRVGRGGDGECWRGKPSKPRRCGRHPERTTTVHQDDGIRALELERLVLEASRALGAVGVGA